ncbi:hypothetical protein MMC07_001481 [Pseudocyphellaria aurata]|nr:hypothetical protein [Pseudocyphellaria aurata]
MPPSLHPRSGLTTSLFGTTLLVSFLVVGMPHIFPCPAPRVAFADSDVSEDGQQRRRRRTQQKSLSDQPGEEGEGDTATILSEQAIPEQKAHECPVPKPRGLVGEVLGFGRGEKDTPRPRVLVETQKEEREQ